MSTIPANLFTILQFSDSEGGRVYRGEKALHSFDESGVIAYEEALDDLSQDFQKIYLKANAISSLSFDPDWESRRLSQVLLAAIDNDAEVIYHRESPSMEPARPVPSVAYFGFDPSLSSVLTDSEFAKVLEENGYSLADEDGEPVDYSQVAWGSVWVFDPATQTGVAVIHDGLVEARLTSPGFASILRIMDRFKREHADCRLFLSVSNGNVNEVYAGDTEFDWQFDLNLNKYRDPEL